MKRTLLILATLTACPPPARMSTPEGCPNGVDTNGYCVESPSDEVGVPRADRTHRVDTEKAIDGFDVAAVPAGATGWRISVTNNASAVAQVLLDESTFVTSGGESAGRLISGDTRRIDTGKTQPPLPVAPGATIKQFVLPEKLIDDEEAEATLVGRNVRASKLKRIEELRIQRYALIEGGKLYVTVVGPAGKQTWTGVVVHSVAGGE